RVVALEQALAAAAPGVFSSAVANVPAVQATGTNGAHGVDTSSDSGVGLHAVGGGVSPTTPPPPYSRVAIFAEGDTGGLYATSAVGPGVSGVSDVVGIYGASTGTVGIGVQAYSEYGPGVLTQSAYGIGLHASGGGAPPTFPTLEAAIVAEGGPNYGLYATSTSGTGVSGYSEGGTGVFGESMDEIGIHGVSTHYRGVHGVSVDDVGVSGECMGGTGVYGVSTYDTGVYGESEDGPGVYGVSTYATAVVGIGGDTGVSGTGGGIGVSGYSEGGYGVFAQSTSGYGVLAQVDSGFGVLGRSHSGAGVLGQSLSGFGVFGYSDSGDAGVFDGTVRVNGTLYKNGGGFQIDHPLDAAHKYLSHSFVESPDMKNLYDGVVTLDANGQAEVHLPDWFETLNTEVRYQLTCLGSYAPVYIAEKLQHNRFTIAGGRAGMEVSWQVTGIRQDRWATAHRLPVEQDKPANEQGYYLHPDLYEEPEEKSIIRAHYPELKRPVLPHK
ncbi:MAG TPA: hypothetical protein VKR83_05905, partial [Ktedonobacteraceae bacterium]|nr:hypothetical protein [Ktedonobacteraceae bacterium]